MEKFIPETKYVEVEFDPFAGPAIQRTTPTTEAQREVWVASQQSREASCAYIESVTLCLDGELDHGHLRSAITYLGQRHEGLRSTISANGLLMIIMEQLDIPQAYTDLSSLDLKERQARLEAIGEEDMEQAFDLLKGPLFRTHLIRTGKGEHQLRLTGHHVILDGWSMGVVMGDISQAYTAYAAGRQPQLPPADRFSDFALAQIDFAASKDFGTVERYWLDLFKGSTPRLDLPTDRPRPLKKTFTSRRIDMELDPVLVQRLREMSTRVGSSLVTTLLTCFELLIYRLTGDSDLCIGLPAAGQNDFGMKELVGNCVNLLALRSTIDGEQPFIDHLKERRSSMLDASDNQKYTFGTLVRRLNVPREPGRIPLCPVVFNIDMDMDSAVSFHDLKHRVISNPRRFENFELFLNIVGRRDGGMAIEAQYNTDLFDAATIRRWLGLYDTLMRSAVDGPERPIDRFPLLPSSEIQALAALQPAPTKIEGVPLMHAGFVRQAQVSPERAALSSGNEQLSYRQLDERSNQLAHALRKRGIGRGQRVGLCLERGPDMLIALIAVLKSGAAYVPLDPGFPQARLDYYAEDAQLALLLTGADVETAPRAWRADADQRVLRMDLDKEWMAQPLTALATDEEIDAKPSDAAYIIYTSGSTGKPKGVCVPHRAVANFLQSMQNQPGITQDDRLVAVTTLSFDIAVLELMLPLCVGAEVVLADRETAMDGTRLAQLLASSGATMMQATPATWRILIDAGWKGGPDFRALCGGEALPAPLADALLKRSGQLWNLYGPTETTIWSTCARIERTENGIHIGRPIANTTVWILDAYRQPCPMGVPGEICIGGEGVALGYLDRPELTADRFVTVPIDGVDTLLYRTGDRGRWLNDGTLEHLGRLDFQVKLRGYRIELGEIEARCNEVPGVGRCVVITREDKPGDVRLAAYLMLSEPQRFDQAALRRHLSATLPQYMVPQHITVLDALPLLPNSKIDRKALPKPETEALEDSGRQAPRNATERTLAEIWERLLGVSGIGIHDNFFDLGGHSLLGIQMLAAARSAFNVELSLLSVFEAPTLSAFAEVIASAGGPTRTPIIPVDRNGEIAVSFGQQRMWLSSQLGRDAYDMSQALHITGELDVNALARALDALVARHEPLRTTFEATPAGQLIQRIHPPAAHDLTVETVASLDEALAWCERESQQPFDLVAGPLFEPRLCRINDRDHILLLRMHHIVGDEWSTDALLRDLGALYQGRALAPLQFAYADFAAWQRAHLTEDVVERELDYWRDQLAGTPALLELPTDRPRPPVFNGNGALAEHRLPSELWRRIEGLGQPHQATPFMTLLAALQVLLHRYSGATDISIGAPISNRDQPGSEDLVGFFINTLVLRTDLSGEPSFIDLLSRVRSVAIGAFTHQDIPFERVVKALAPERNPSHTPLFQVSFIHQSSQTSPEAPGLAFKRVDIGSTTSKFDLSLFTVPSPDGLVCTLEYNTDVFDAATIERLLEHFQILLEGIVADPALTIDRLPLLPSSEILALAALQPAPTAIEGEPLMHAGFVRQADATPERAALSSGNEHLSYRQLDERSNQLAHALRERGIGREHRVGLCLERGPDMLVALIAVLKSGAAYVPLDPGFPQARLDYYAEDAQLALLLTGAHVETAPRAWRADADQRVLLMDRDKEWMAQPVIALAPEEQIDAKPSDAAYIIYTSGSTGKPKGVCVPHRAVANFLQSMQQQPGITQNDRLVAVTTLSFDIAVLELMLPLCVGAEVVLADRETAMDGTRLAQLLASSGATMMQATPATWRILIDAGWKGGPDFRALCGGEALPAPLADALLKRSGELWNLYGPTEATVWSTCARIERTENGIHIGRPIANTTVWILDAYRQPCPLGVPGEICIGGEGVALGYLDRPELTADRFVIVPIDGVDTLLYRTGDRGRWLNDGTLEHLGRLDFQVKLRGYRIELGEIEARCSEAPGVGRCVVITREDQPGDVRLAAYLMLSEPQRFDQAALRKHLSATLPQYMVPQHITVLDALPLLPNGKIDRKALPKPETEALEDSGRQAPRNATERTLAEIWERLLGVSGIGIHDNFFDLGGHSLLGIQMLAAARSAFNVELSLLSIFKAPTLSAFAEVIAGAGLSVRPQIVPVDRDGELEASFGQQRMWTSAQLGRDAYDMSQAIRITGELDVNALARTLDALVARHEPLRTTFETTPAGQLIQRIHAPAAHELTVETVTSLDDALAWCERECQQPFDLVAGPVFEPRLCRINDRDHILLLRMHHIVGDEWSIDVMLRDLGALYQGRALAPLQFAYADFAAWQRAHLTEDVVERELDYWRDQLAGTPALLELPTDRPRPPVFNGNGALAEHRLPSELWRRIEGLGQPHQATPFMTLLAALQVLLHRYSGATDISIGAPISNRDQPGSEDLVGFFINTLVLRTDLSGEPSFIDLLSRVRSVAIGAFTHQDIPFERVVKALAPERNPSHTPLFQVSFIHQSSQTSPEAPGLAFKRVDIGSTTSKFDLSLFTVPSPDGLVCTLEYNTDVFDAATIERLLEHFQILLEGIVADPALTIDRLPLLPSSEILALAALQPAPTAIEGEPLMHAGFVRQADATPERAALSSGNEHLSYRQLDERSNQLAHALRKRGIGRGQRVGLCLERGPDMLIALIAVLKSGAAYVPLDPGFPQARLDYYAEDAQLALLLTGAHVETAPRAWRADADQRVLQLDRDKDWIAQPVTALTPDEQIDAKPSDAAYIIYTSGSTGKPKGVCIPHRAVANFLQSMQHQPGITQDDRLVAVTTLSFDIAVLELMLPLCVGAEVVLADRETAMDGTRLAQLLTSSGATMMQATPATWRILIDAGWKGGPDFRALCGGEALPAPLADALLKRSGQLWNLYGPTETTVWSTCARIERTENGIHIGRPIANTTVWILDAYRQPCPLGVPGEICIGGEGVALGYLDRPELTADRFVTVPIDGVDTLLYRTGDRGRWLNDGTLEHLGRLDFQVKLRGYRIELGEIEARCSEAPGVGRCVVITREDQPGDVRLAAYLMLSEPQRFDQAALRRHLSATLPQYMVPQHITALDALPLLPNGKIDRKALPKPETEALEDSGRQAPRNATEQTLAEIWERLLGVSGIGINDNFFSLGGHSLLGIQMLAAARQAFNVDLPLLSIFKAPTLSAFAEVIANAGLSARAQIVPVDRDGELEASFGQQRIWMSLQLGRDAYDMSQAIRITGELDVNALARALDALVARHEPLRTTFETTPAGQLIQRIHPPAAHELTVENVGSLDEAIARCQQEFQQPFDLSAGPVFEPMLFSINGRDHVLFLRMHHIVGDEWSIDVMLRDLGALYQGRALAPLQFAYADFAAWQRAQFTDEVVERELDYWRGQLAGAPALLELPTDRPRPPVFSSNGALGEHRLPSDLWRRIEALGQRHQATPFMTLLAAFQVLLHRYAGATDISIGAPITNRDQPGSEDVVGFFINTLVLRTDLSGEPSFIDLLSRVRSVALGAFTHQDIPFERVVEALAPKRNPAHTPLFQVSFIHQSKQASPEAPGLAFAQVDFASSTTKFDLTLFTVPTSDGLTCTLEYNTDLFDAATIERMLEHFHILIEGIVEDPALSIDELPLLSATERQLIAKWNGGYSSYPHAAMDELFEEVSTQYPDNVAVELGKEKLSYAELRGHVNTLASELAKRGLRHGEPVGVCMDRSIGTQTAMLAILRAGGCYVPFDLSYPAERVRYMLEDAQVKFMLTQAHLADQFPGCEDRIILLDNWGRSGELPFTDAPPPARVHDANSPAYIIYTSGSTGMPKGVVVPHRGVVRLVRDQNYVEFSSSLVILQISNLCFDGSVFEIWGALLNGAKLVVQPQQKPTLQEIVDNITQHKVNTACFTSGLFNLMMDEHVEDLHGLKYLLAGGDALSVRHVKRALQVLGPGVMINGYGPTENTDYTTCHVINDEADLQIRVPIGRPISNTTVHILDAGMNPVPVGIKGELFTGGDGIALGYWQRPELTASRFIDDPFSTVPGAKLYRTGDLSRWRPDGTVDFLGRMDGQVKVRGFRVELGEIENAISTISEVKDRVVITLNDVSGEKQLVAYLVPKDPDVDNPEVLTTTVRNHLRKVLPEYMVPLAFVVLPKLPLTGNGKVDRRALPAPELDTSARAAYEAPAGEVEQALAKIWSTLLHVDGIGRHDNFFELGGHSLLGIRMLSAIRSAFNVELTLSSIFETQTLSGLAEAIFSTARPARTPILPVPRDGELAASFGQQRMWMSSQFGRDAYDMSQAIRITGELDVNALARALDALVARHEPLRTTFETTPAGQLIQRIHPPAAHELTVENVGSLDEALAWCQQEFQQPFDLVAGPLFESQLCRINAHDHILLLRMHHIVGDEWSIDVMLRDLGALYQGRALAPLQFAYADFAAWQRAQFTDEVVERELDYWRGQLAGAPALLELPTDRPRPPVFSSNGALGEHHLPPDLWRRIEALGQRHQATPFMTLLAAFQVLLHRYAGATDISIGAPITNRGQTGSEDLVGFFINTLVLRTDLSGEPSFIDLLSRVRSVALGAFTHQDIPFERVVEALAPERNPAYSPLFQVSFAHQAKQASPEATGLAFAQVDIAFTTSKFDLTLFTVPTSDGLACTLEYNTDLFDAATIERMLEHFHILLEGIVADPALSIDQLPLLPVSEQQLIAKWNGGYSPYPHAAMDELFEEISTRYPDHVAVELGKEKLSYAELNGHVNTLAAELAKRGLRHGEPVGVCMDRSIGTQTAMLAILRAGGCYVPFDLSYPAERIRYMLEDAQVKFMLTQAHLTDQLPGSEDRIILLDRLGRSDKLPFTTSPAPPREHDADSPAYIMYTSGSTGTPKGVVVPHRGVVRLVRDQNYMAYGPELTFLQMGNLCFDASTFEIWGALLNGARLVVQPQAKATLTEIIDSLREKQVTSVLFPTGLFNLLVDEHLNELRGLKNILTGGDVMSPVHARKALKLLGPGVLVNAYGPTENSVIVTCHAVDRAEQLERSVPIGRPIANTQAYILDGAMRQVPIGVTGDLYAGGDGVALGYWQRPELTAAQFLDDPFSKKTGAKLYRTGDRAAWRPDGTIDFLGRADGQVKVRGFRIELAEIETAIGLLPEVKDNVVVVRNDIPGEKQLVAYVVPRALDAANGDEGAQEQLIGTLREHLRKTMPAYMAPTAFVIMEALPLNASGKVAKHALPVPEHRVQSLAEMRVEPRNATEERLAILWGELLNTPDPGVHDNFFDLGGQSMIGIRLLARVEDSFGARLPLNSLFQAPTIAQFAELMRVGNQKEHDLQNLALMQPLGDRPPFFCIHGDEANHYLPKYLGNDQPFYAYFHQGEDGSPILHRTVESIAAHFIKEMRTVRPEGPYLLGGYSFGGIVAYEMAQQLTAAGQEVPLLAMFDTYAPDRYQASVREGQRLHDPLKHMIMRQLVKIEQARGLISSPKLRHFHIIDTYDKAIRNYKIKKYDGAVTMYKAEKSPGADDMGWAALASQINVRMLPGDHYSLIREPDVEKLAQRLSSDINLAVEKSAAEAI